MKAMLEHIDTGLSGSMRIQHFRQAKMDIPWHFHPEIELVLMIRGTGRVFINDNFESFGKGDLIVIGSRVPHVYIADPAGSEDEMEFVTLQFHPDLFQEPMMRFPEFFYLRKMLELSMQGIRLLGRNAKSMAKCIKAMERITGIAQVSGLIEILDMIGRSRKVLLVSTASRPGEVGSGDSVRLQKIINYLMQNYHKHISLDEVARIANLNRTAFCRYFRKHVRKTFTMYLNELRIGYASRLLMNNTLTVSEAGYKVGYNNMSYYIRQFKRIHGVTPSAYRDRLQANTP